MNNKRYKLIPTSLWNIGAIETWLSDMAAKGLFVMNLGKYFASFTKAEPATIQYRIDMIPADTDEELEAKKSKYKACGWSYEDSYLNFHIFYAPPYSATYEVYSITDEQAELMKPILKSSIKKLIWATVLMAIVILIPFFISSSRMYTRIIEINIFDLLAYPMFVLAFIHELYKVILIKKFIKSLRKGVPISHHNNWRMKSLFSTFYKSAFAIILVGLILIPSKSYFKDKNLILTNGGTTLPVITLRDISDNRPKYKAFQIDTTNPSYSTYGRSETSILAPQQYENNQSYRLINTSNKVEEISLNTRSYELRYEFMTDNFFKEQVDYYNHLWETTPKSLAITSYEDLDNLVIYKSGLNYHIFASKGHGVITLNYTVDDDLETLLKTINEKLELLDSFDI